MRPPRHRIHVSDGARVTAVRERIERVLSVRTFARPEGGPWGVYFDAPADVDLDFLRPDVLPPSPVQAGEATEGDRTSDA